LNIFRHSDMLNQYFTDNYNAWAGSASKYSCGLALDFLIVYEKLPTRLRHHRRRQPRRRHQPMGLTTFIAIKMTALVSFLKVRVATPSKQWKPVYRNVQVICTPAWNTVPNVTARTRCAQMRCKLRRAIARCLVVETVSYFLFLLV